MKTPLQDFDKSTAIQYETDILIGIDEAGRGPLAGPVVACACYVPPSLTMYFSDVNDSKKITAKKREEVLARMRHLGVLYGVGFASAREIDRLNILQATFLAMRRASVKFTGIPAPLVLVDGPHLVKGLNLRQIAVVDGDAKSLNIAAASIVAKVARDKYMETLDKLYPQYGFAAHKGYGTAAHLEALRKYGPCPQHRRSFGPVRAVLQPSLLP